MLNKQNWLKRKAEEVDSPNHPSRKRPFQNDGDTIHNQPGGVQEALIPNDVCYAPEGCVEDGLTYNLSSEQSP